MTRTILLADDSVTIQKVVELTFLDEDVKVVSVGNGSDALAKFDEVRPDVVLADVHMPGADGYEVCAAAAKSLPGVPVLLLVGTFEVFDPERAAAAGAVGHLKKPFDSQELLRRVRELLERAPAGPAAPILPVELPAWDAPVAAGAAESTPGEDWSFEPVAQSETEPEPTPSPSASTPAELFGAPAAGPDAGESWSSFGTARFSREMLEARPAEEPDAEALAAEFEPLDEPESAPERAPEPQSAPMPAPASAEPVAASAAAGNGASAPLSDADVERIARRVAELVSERAVRDVAWEVVPDLAEVLLKARIRELEASVE